MFALYIFTNIIIIKLIHLVYFERIIRYIIFKILH